MEQKLLCIEQKYKKLEENLKATNKHSKTKRIFWQSDEVLVATAKASRRHLDLCNSIDRNKFGVEYFKKQRDKKKTYI